MNELSEPRPGRWFLLPAVIFLIAAAFLPILQHFFGGGWYPIHLLRRIVKGSGAGGFNEWWLLLLWGSPVLILLIDLGWFAMMAATGDDDPPNRRGVSRILFIITEIVLSFVLVGMLALSLYLVFFMYSIPSWSVLCLLLSGWCTSRALRAEART
jgi:hypothetical protein